MKPPGITVVYHPDHSITLSDGKGAEVTYRDPDTVGRVLRAGLGVDALVPRAHRNPWLT
jgi:hypothetical protein